MFSIYFLFSSIFISIYRKVGWELEAMALVFFYKSIYVHFILIYFQKNNHKARGTKISFRINTPVVLCQIPPPSLFRFFPREHKIRLYGNLIFLNSKTQLNSILNLAITKRLTAFFSEKTYPSLILLTGILMKSD